jgi:cell wall-associated NlpC family hydrolase
MTGAAAVAIVSQDGSFGPNAETVAVNQAELGESVAAIGSGVEITAGDEGEFTLDTPQITVKDDPAPSAQVAAAPRGTTTTARPVSSSKAVTQAIGGSAVIAEAAKYVGASYRSGGTNPSTGFDCSGFVSYVYGKFGISLPRSSGAYFSVGVRVSDPQPGDIIVTPGHVGIYAGKNLQIDSPRPGKTIQFRPIWQSNPIFVRVTG